MTHSCASSTSLPGSKTQSRLCSGGSSIRPDTAKYTPLGVEFRVYACLATSSTSRRSASRSCRKRSSPAPVTSVRSDWAVLASSIMELSALTTNRQRDRHAGSDTMFLERGCVHGCVSPKSGSYCERSMSKVQSVQQMIADVVNINVALAVLVDIVIVKWYLPRADHDGSRFRPKECHPEQSTILEFLQCISQYNHWIPTTPVTHINRHVLRRSTVSALAFRNFLQHVQATTQCRTQRCFVATLSQRECVGASVTNVCRLVCTVQE